MITVYFSGPGTEQRVIAVTRSDIIENPIPLDQFRKSLTAKYGEPTGYTQQKIPVWEEAGKPTCLRIRFPGTPANPGPVDPATMRVEMIYGYLTKNQERFPNALPADLKTCGAFVYYEDNNTPLPRMINATMVDIGALIASEESNAAWVDNLANQAIKEREAKGAAPRL